MLRSVFTILLLVLSLHAGAQNIDNNNLRVIHGPWLQNLGENGVTIMWTTNKAAVPAVILTDSDGTNRTVRNSTDGIINGGGVLHKVRIEGLEAGAHYNYKPSSIEISRYQPYKVYYGDTLSRKEYSFTTLDKDKKEIRAIVMNDIHEKSSLISDYLEETQVNTADIVFYNGDIINYLQDEEQIYNGYIDSSVYYFASEIPFYMVRGNHETRGMLARNFKDYNDFPDNKFYYAFTHGPVHFVALDCGEDKPDENRYYFDLADYDTYRLKQLEWLKDHIKSKEFKEAKYRVVVVHMPIIKADKMGYGMQFLSDHFGPVLKEAGIDVLFAGHTHRVGYYTAEESGFDYPVMVSSNKTFIELQAGKDGISAVMKDSSGKIVMEKTYKK
ncbi:MAG: FN3 domain-containing metallophosphoesterase family protein [Bacteroidales bacterium]|nr:FN3 domain-containing metallophosphoesterase family protein [Bacteroidales bacterium]